tara:strand:+ start:14066 stop:15325 length:1260 start_codon:yes stop_codon:yes gene_type:complete
MPEEMGANDGTGHQPESRPAVRWDRSLAREMTAARSTLGSSASEAITGKLKIGAPMRRGVKRVLVSILKRPALKIRDFLIAPLAERIDQARLSQEYLINQTRLVQEKAAASFQSNVDQSIGAIQQSLSGVQQSLGFLHIKADEQTRKIWPIVHLRDAYAVPLADGYIYIPDSDEAILLMYARATSEGLEPGTRRVLMTILRPGNVAIDVGASLGMHTIAMANAVGPGGHVDAFEAEPRLMPVLNRTTATNGMHHVSLHACAIGSHDGEVSFNVAQTIGHSSLYDLGSESLVREKITVAMKMLDTAIASDADVNLIKIDVEGAELDVIRGAKRILSQSTDCAIVAECGPSHLRRIHVSLQDWIGEFTSLGYEGYTIQEPGGHIDPLNMQWLAGQESVNIVFVKAGGALSRRLVNELGTPR